MNIRIVTDSACDLPDDLMEEHDIEIVPLNIRFGDEEYVDRFELNVESFYDKLAEHATLPETSAPAPGRFQQAFEKQADAGADVVICVCLASGLSATMESALQGAKLVSGQIDVRVVDTQTVSGLIGISCVEAARAAADGVDADQIVADLEASAERNRIFGALNTLENLKKGGRIGNAQALLGNMLAIKPILEISHGTVEEASKQRTRKKALTWLRDRALADDVEGLVVLNGMAPDFDEFVDMLAPHYHRDDLFLGVIGPVVGTHAGPGVIGIGFRQKG